MSFDLLYVNNTKAPNTNPCSTTLKPGFSFVMLLQVPILIWLYPDASRMAQIFTSDMAIGEVESEFGGLWNEWGAVAQWL